MPEEINRVLTDRLSDLLFTHSPEAVENLAAEGIDDGRDPLRRQHDDRLAPPLHRKARDRAAWRRSGCRKREYVLVTLHRPSNVDDPARLGAIVDALHALAARAPSSSRSTRARVLASTRWVASSLEAAGVRCTGRLGYIEFLSLQGAAGAIVTDSGGVQEEASALGVPCFTLRRNTERPITHHPRDQHTARRRPER